MAPVNDKGLLYFLGALCTVIVLILVSLLFTPPLIAEDSAPQITAINTELTDSNLDHLVGNWEGTFTNLGALYQGQIETSYDITGQWLKMVITTWTDSSRTKLAYVATVYIRPENHSDSYKAYLVDNTGVGQVGHARVGHGVWNWVWDYDDGTRETGTMVTSAPGRLTYESQVNDAAGHVLPAVEMDFTRVYATAKLGR